MNGTILSGRVTMPSDGKALWQRDVSLRRRMRGTLEELVQVAKKLRDPSEGFLQEARARIGGRDLNLARDAVFDLSYAADQCSDPNLRARMKAVEEELQSLVS